MSEIHRLKATRVVMDSLSGFELGLAPTFRDDFRESLLRLVTALSTAGVTVLMTSELEDRYTDLRFSPYGTAFLTDAIIVQRYIEVDSRLKRVIAVVKVRASDHSNELREFSIDGQGIHIGAMLPDQEGLLGGRPTKKRAADRPRSAVPTMAEWPGPTLNTPTGTSAAARLLVSSATAGASRRRACSAEPVAADVVARIIRQRPGGPAFAANEQLVLAMLRARPRPGSRAGAGSVAVG
jgi:hypothetical protein